MSSQLLVGLDPPAAGRGRVQAAGQLDGANAHVLLDAVDAELEGQKLREVEIDLRGVTACDLGGLAAVLLLRRRARDHGVNARLLISADIRAGLLRAQANLARRCDRPPPG